MDGKRIDEWIWEEGEMWPSRGTIGFSQFTEDPLRDGFIDPASISDYTGGLSRYVTALGYDPNHKTVFSGRGHGDHPDFMCWPTHLTSGFLLSLTMWRMGSGGTCLGSYFGIRGNNASLV